MDKHNYSTPVSLKNIQVTDTFWKGEMELVRKEVIPYQWDALNDRVEGAAPSFCMHNFKAAGKLNREKKVTVILITHYMDEVVHADKVYVMDDGEIVLAGTPREVFTQVEDLKRLRLDVPQVTELAYELKKAGMDLPDGVLTIDELTEALESYRDR